MKKFNVLILLFTLLSTVKLTAQEQKDLDKQKAFLIYTLAISSNKIDWPGKSKNDTVKIGVLWNKKIHEKISMLIDKFPTKKNGFVKVSYLSSTSSLQTFDIIYANQKDGISINQLHEGIGNKPILLITDNFTYEESMISFFEYAGSTRLKINEKNCKKQGLDITQSISSFAVDKDLVSEGYLKDRVNELENSLSELRKKYSDEKWENIDNTSQIDGLNYKNKELNQTLEAKEEALAEKQAQLDQILNNISAKSTDLDSIESQLKTKEEEIQLSKKQLENQNSKLELAEQRYQVVNKLLDSQKHITYIAITILLVFAILAILAYKNYRIQKRQALIIAKQKDEVDEKNREITDSITYAKRIQEAILPPLKLVQSKLEQSFIFYLPKDIVAGDFYWMEAKGDKVIFAAADCTGHGVPGAMVSVVCSNALNRAVREFALEAPAAILDKTLEIVIERFEKSEEEVKDGMDIALCNYHPQKKLLQYAGAHNPLWIIRSGSEEIEEIKGNKQPIGKYAEHVAFQNHEVQLQKGDSVYVFSDGYVDQFGGEKGKKLKSVNFKKFLLSIQDQNMEQQRMELKKHFEQWRGELEQLDDVCVIGFRA
ncbi:MAG: YfiR/HmsC family protein [Vicingaceae bacterium]